MKIFLANILINFQCVQDVIDKIMPHIVWEIGFTGWGTPKRILPEPEQPVLNLSERFVVWIFSDVTKLYIETETVRRRQLWHEATKDI